MHLAGNRNVDKVIEFVETVVKGTNVFGPCTSRNWTLKIDIFTKYIKFNQDMVDKWKKPRKVMLL